MFWLLAVPGLGRPVATRTDLLTSQPHHPKPERWLGLGRGSTRSWISSTQRASVPESPCTATRGAGIKNWKNQGAALATVLVPQFSCLEWPRPARQLGPEIHCTGAPGVPEPGSRASQVGQVDVIPEGPKWHSLLKPLAVHGGFTIHSRLHSFLPSFIHPFIQDPSAEDLHTRPHMGQVD